MEDKESRYIDSLWALVDPLTMEQAAALIAGVDPNIVVFSNEVAQYFCDKETGHTKSTDISRVNTAFSALRNAILAKKLKAKIMHDSRPFDESAQRDLIDLIESREYFNLGPEHVAEEDEKFHSGYFIKEKPNWSATMIDLDELKKWLISMNMKTGFFFEKKEKASHYLNQDHPRYSAKLAAAIKVWEIMEDENLLAGKSAKSAMTNWLQANYKELELVYNGKISNNAIEQVVSVVNWQTSGGAPKTPDIEPT